MANLAEFTVEENIAYLSHSDLPSIIVEGKDDIIIYRHLDNIVEGALVIAVGGRQQVLDIFKAKQNNLLLDENPIVFIADQDTLCNTGIPEEYQNELLIFTTGYSLENDVFVDHECQKIIDNHANKAQFYADKQQFLKWYALALQATLVNTEIRGQSENVEQIPDSRKLSMHPQQVLNQFPLLMILENNETYPTELEDRLANEFPLTIHGKSLLALFTKNCKEYDSQAMFQTVAVRRGDNVERIFDDVKQAFCNI